MRRLDSRRWRGWLALAVLAGFVVAGCIGYWRAGGDDLGSSYLGCRVLADGHGDELYSYDEDEFSDVGDDEAWAAAKTEGGFSGYSHPYVQTPLWAWGLRPLCTHLEFPAFRGVFLVVVMLCFAGSIGIVAWFWVPQVFGPVALAVVVVGLWFSVAFQYAMSLIQTHVLFLAMTLGALVLAERRRPGWAGLLLAGAAAVKVTPAALVVYWVLTRRWRAAAWMAGWSAVIVVVTLAATGRELMGTYLGDLQRISRVLLLSQNNQSFAAWVMGRFYPVEEVADYAMLPLPAVVRVGSMVLTLGFTAWGGWIDRRRERRTPVGAMMALVAATIFAPIAWTHYSVVLAAPLMVLAGEMWGRRRDAWWWVVAGLGLMVLGLNVRPFATDVLTMTVGPYSVVRGQFYAGVLCLGALWVVSWAGDGWVGSGE